MEQKQWPRALALLDAVERPVTARYHLLRGQVFLELEDYTRSADCLKQAETEYSRQVLPLLERCYRELGDFQQAYLYACKQRER